MKRWLKIVLVLLVLIVIIGAAFRMLSGGEETGAETPSVEVTRGDLVDKALAVGTIEPNVEISVKSQLSGVVSRQFAEVGDYVQAGAPLLEVRPTPTPQELVDAERQIELRQLELANAEREIERQRPLLEKQLLAEQDFDVTQRRYDEARLQLQMAEERLELLQSGRVASGRVATVIPAPITGFVIDKAIEIGDPVVPLTSYQEGTVLMTMANMDDLLFRGTVDEIDVGRLAEGMPVAIKVGALPNTRVNGTLSKIWLKAEKEDNATVFPIEIALGAVTMADSTADAGEGEVAAAPTVLRAGYSANAEVIIEQREDVLLLPERVITFADDTAKVDVLLPDGTTEERVIETGLSDAIHIQVVRGLDEGDKVAEKPVRVIE